MTRIVSTFQCATLLEDHSPHIVSRVWKLIISRLSAFHLIGKTESLQVDILGKKEERIEILNWYHLMENLHKTEASKNQREQLKAYLWMGEVITAINYLNQEQPLGGHQFSRYSC